MIKLSVMSFGSGMIVFLMIMIAYAAIVGSKRDGMVEYIGSLRDVFKTGKAASVVSLEDFAGIKGLYALGPVADLDGEITIFNSRPYITKVRGTSIVRDTTFKHEAFYFVWSEQTR